MKTVIFIRTTSIYNDSRAIKEINSLSSNGYKVIALGWDRTGNAEKKCKKLFKDNVSFDFFECHITKIGFKHINKLLEWFNWIYRHLSIIVEQNKFSEIFIHSCDLDTGIPAYLFLLKSSSFRIRFIYDIYDYYVDLHTVPAGLRTLVENLEIRIINYADIVIICNEIRKKQIAKSKPKKLLIIHNSPDLRGIKLPLNKSKYDYAYCGSLFPVLRLVNEILQEYPKHQNIKMAMAGYGSYDEIAEKLSKEFNNFDFYGTLTYPEVLEIESSAKVLSAIYDPSIRNHRMAAPNKFYESLALGKPVIVCKGSGIDKLVEKYNLGLTISYDATEFYKALGILLNNPMMRQKMGQNGRKLYEEKYKWEIMEQILLKAYSEL